MISISELEPGHPFIRLADGSMLPLPKHPDLQEFVLPGNAREFPQFLAFHDPATETGAVYSYRASMWQTIWPCKAEEFWRHCIRIAQDLAGQPGGELAMMAASDAPDAIRH